MINRQNCLKREEEKMKLPKALIYALACISELERRPNDFYQVNEIAAAQAIPPAYCQKVLMLLASAGCVESVKGRGFRLICSPGDVKALDFIKSNIIL